MGRRRKNELKPGDNVTIYIPQDVERDVLHFMRTQANLSKTVFKILEGYVLRKNRDYIEFDDFYSDRADMIKHDSLRRSYDKDLESRTNKLTLSDDIKEFIRAAIKQEVKNVTDTTNEEEKVESVKEAEVEHEVEKKSEIKSRHEDKLKMVQNIELEGRQKENMNGDMDDLFNEFSKTIEDDSSKKVKNSESKNYLWEYEDE
jgi:hypothetical protein